MTDEHGHEHHHEHGYVEAVEQLRHEAAHYYEEHFDWRGHEPPAGWTGPAVLPAGREVAARCVAGQGCAGNRRSR